MHVYCGACKPEKPGALRWVETNRDQWLDHPDPNVDLSLYLYQWQDDFDHNVLPFSMFVNEARIKEHSIGIGDEVFLIGLFSQHYGSQRNVPLLRVGNIAAMPEEPVQLRDGSMMDAYLVEARSIGGLSGSPVFVHLGFTRHVEGRVACALRGPSFFLLGLMHGHWDSPDAGAGRCRGRVYAHSEGKREIWVLR